MATNRHDTLDPALLRPGRLDRKIEFPNPDRRQKRLIFQVCTSKMNLSEEIDLEDYVQRPEKLSAADISAIAQEAGLHAVRNNRYVILNKDFEKAYKSDTAHTHSTHHTQHTQRTPRTAHSTHWQSSVGLTAATLVLWHHLGLPPAGADLLSVCGWCPAGTTSSVQTLSTSSTPASRKSWTALVHACPASERSSSARHTNDPITSCHQHRSPQAAAEVALIDQQQRSRMLECEKPQRHSSAMA